MTSSVISPSMRQLVFERAQGRCEYCLIHQNTSIYSHEVDHIIALKHGGRTIADNLAFCCLSCNRHKGSDLTTFDPMTGELVRLFNPRCQSWVEHFDLAKVNIIGKTPTGRATAFLLMLNIPKRLLERQVLMAQGLYG